MGGQQCWTRTKGAVWLDVVLHPRYYEEAALVYACNFFVHVQGWRCEGRIENQRGVSDRFLYSYGDADLVIARWHTPAILCFTCPESTLWLPNQMIFLHPNLAKIFSYCPFFFPGRLRLSTRVVLFLIYFQLFNLVSAALFIVDGPEDAYTCRCISTCCCHVRRGPVMIRL